MKPTHILTGFEGHIVLYCKHYYTCPVGFIEGLRMIWAIRCGYDYNNDKSVDEYIANSLYKLLKNISSNDKINYLQERIHKDINNNRYSYLSSIETLISIYCSELSIIQVKKQIGTKYHWIIKLPKPIKRVFNRILRGKGKYDDYYLIEPKI